ncbi:AraC family transcriptional regulator [Alcanivorax marinus]|uniref:AraC family transcriptional regulator n=1 Tax=Alloalcanivorax marinus TaxID=1177169 RepID=A0A9Q3UJX3_9GAMM|nr:AraC family transcriptional regulator [Alloalcanivorax marinus]MCC4307580.1 AraC family transcriptional regulator [Alloalcanivorax marinus]
MTTATTVAAWPLALVGTLERGGVSAAALLEAAGLEPALLGTEPGGRVPVDAMSRLWTAAERLSGDPAIGLRVGQVAQPMHLRLLGLLVQTAPTLDRVLDLVVRFQALISTSVTVSRLHRPGAEGLAIQPLPGEPVHACALDAFVAVHVKHLQRVARPGVVRDIELSRPRPTAAGLWGERLGVEVRFGAGRNVIWHDAGGLRDPLPLGDAALCRQHEQLAEQALAELDRAPPLIRTLRGLLRLRADNPPSLAELAASVNLSERSLRRHLADAGSGYRKLIEEQRAEQAADWLRRDGLPVGEVARRLGFSDASNFGKAFKRWYGVSPDRFRQDR